MQLNMDWRVLVALAVLVAAHEIDWDWWRKRYAMYRNGAQFGRAQERTARTA